MYLHVLAQVANPAAYLATAAAASSGSSGTFPAATDATDVTEAARVHSLTVAGYKKGANTAFNVVFGHLSDRKMQESRVELHRDEKYRGSERRRLTTQASTILHCTQEQVQLS